jgi:hypothetical protein
MRLISSLVKPRVSRNFPWTGSIVVRGRLGCAPDFHPLVAGRLPVALGGITVDAPGRLSDTRGAPTVGSVTRKRKEGEDPTELFVRRGKLTKRGDKRKVTCYEWHAVQNGSRSLRPSPAAHVGNRLTTSGIEPPVPHRLRSRFPTQAAAACTAGAHSSASAMSWHTVMPSPETANHRHRPCTSAQRITYPHAISATAIRSGGFYDQANNAATSSRSCATRVGSAASPAIG